MANRLLQTCRKLGSAYNWKQDVGSLKHNADATELSLLSARSAGDCSLSDARDFQAQPHEPVNISRIHRLRRRFTGWRFAVLHFATWAFIVFSINLAVTTWASATHAKTGGNLSEGDCGRIKNLNRGLHILINVFSTILLSGSNYCMQCLSAPTRTEIDKAHEARYWLDVGVPSIRNLKHISRRRLCIWLLLGLSSIPLHLLYNSAIYATTSTNSYSGYVINEAFLNTECSDCLNRTEVDQTWYDIELKELWTKSREGLLERLDPMECLNEYATPLQSNRRHVLLVTNDSYNATTSLRPVEEFSQRTFLYSLMGFDATFGVRSSYAPNSFSWVCSGLSYTGVPCANEIEQIKSSFPPWKVGDMRGVWSVQYCLSEPVVPRCTLRFSRIISIIVTMLNLFKAVLMICVVSFMKSNPILTMGDAVASFIDNRDIYTVDSSMMSANECRTGYRVNARPWEGRDWRWKDTTSQRRRYTTLLLYVTVLITVAALMIWGARTVSNVGRLSLSAVFGLGLGAVDTRALVDATSLENNVVAIALLANLPQVVLSFCYFAYNSLFTAMLMGYEWTSYGHKRKGLRVSVEPKGSQRSTYFLQLPYRFGFPLVILSATLHWLISQSMFVVSLDIYDRSGEPVMGTDESAPSQKRLGYSPVAMLAVIILGIFMVASVVGFGHLSYKSGMSLAASCSLAISAECHPEEQSGPRDSVLSEQKLQWGIVSVDQEGIGHCAFSSKEVGPLVKGAMYR